MAALFLALPAASTRVSLTDADWAKVRAAMQERCPGVVREDRFGALVCLTGGRDACAYADDHQLLVADGRLHATDNGGAGSAADLPALAAMFDRTACDQVLAGLDGSFALCRYDRRAGRLLLARDRFGSRPLYWFDRGDCLFAASECRMLAVVAGPLRIDPSVMNEVLASRWIVGEAHLLAPVRQVLGGSVTTFGAGRTPRSSRYWHMTFSPEPAGPGAMAHHVDATRRALELAIARAADGRQKVAVLLSGGVDSSIIAAAARTVVDECVGYVARMPGSPNVEMERAQFVARRLGIACRVVDVRVPFNASDLAAMVRRLEEPPRNPNNFVLAQLLERIAGENDLVLQGDGAEILFGLADSRSVARFSRKQVWTGFLPASVRRAFASWLTGSRVRRLHALGDLLRWTPLQYASRLECIHYPLEVQRLLPAALASAEGHLPMEEFSRYDHFDDGLQAYQARTFLASSLLRHDRLAQPLGVTSVAPLLLAPVVDVACRLPRDLRFTTRSKPILRALCDADLPPEVSRWPKMGFEVPWEGWLRSIDDTPSTQSRAAAVLPAGYATSMSAEARWTTLTLDALMASFNIGEAHRE